MITVLNTYKFNFTYKICKFFILDNGISQNFNRWYFDAITVVLIFEHALRPFNLSPHCVRRIMNT